MATINRFNKFLPRDYSMRFYVPEFYTPDFEQWDSILSGQQQRYNAAVAATQKYPKHLEWRNDLAGEYKKNVDTKIKDITDTYVNDGVRSGNRKLRDFAFEMNQQWNPGGLAHELEKEYEGYQSGIKQITDYYEKNKAENSANRTYSLHKLNKAAKEEFKYDPETGLYNGVSVVPELIPYVDIADEALKVVKEIKDSGTTSIIKRDNAWFEKIKREGVTEDTIKEVTDALLEQPKYSQQIGVEKWLVDQNTTPEQKEAMVAQATEGVMKHVTDAQAEINKLSKSKSLDDKKNLQKQLKEAGYYDGPIDGLLQGNTKKAIDLYLADLNSKAAKNVQGITFDNLVENQIKTSYAQPLIKTFAREKIDRDLIFNKQWEVNNRIAAQRKNTADLVGAIQSLKNPEQSNYVVTPGAGSPMQTMDKLRADGQQVYNESKKAFDQIAQWSGITDIIGYRAPNKIHEVTQARMQSKSYEDFLGKMQQLGYSEGISNNAWQFYNSPAAGELYSSYTNMNTAKESVDNIDRTKTSMITDFIKTPEGKKEYEKFKKRFGFTGSETEFAAKVSGNQFISQSPGSSMTVGMGIPVGTGTSYVNEGKDFISKMDNYYKGKPEAVPTSLRGYRFKALKGAGADMENIVKKDFKDGYTLGYTSLDGGEPYYSHIGSNDKVDLSEVDMEALSFEVTPAGVIYYATGKDKEGKPVSAVMNAPKSHLPNLAQVAIDMKKESVDGSNEFVDNLSNSLYAVATEGAQYEQAVDDALVLNDKNTTRLSRVIDPQRSSAGKLETFANNVNVKGTPVGGEKIANGLTYQKFKVYNPKTNSSAYMLTVQTNDGLYLPVKNKNGGYYYETSSQAESHIWDSKIKSQLPVEINQQKFKPTNLTEDELKALTIGVSSQISSDEDNDE